MIIMVQNFVIILMLWSYNKSVGAAEKLMVLVFFASYAYVLFFGNLLPTVAWDYISSSGTGLSKSLRVSLTLYRYPWKDASNHFELPAEVNWSDGFPHFYA